MQVAVINPYDFHARSEAACAALLIADTVVTVRPAPLEGTSPEQLHEAAEDAPAFGELIRAWAWSGSLWRSGVVREAWDGEAPLPDIQRAAREIAAGSGPLAEVVGASRFEDTREYLQTMCRDVLRGGRDPGVAVPVAVGLEAYAGRRGLTVVRGQGQSLASRFEAKTARAQAQVTTAIVLGTDAEELIELRGVAADALEKLREALGTGDPEDLGRAGDAVTETVSDWLETAPRGVRGVAVRLSLARTQAGSVKASAMSALGATPDSGIVGATGASLAPRPTQVMTIRTLPWALGSR